jgi:hypothetical protein
MADQVEPHRGHPVPSARARELVQGAYDLHVHVLPDILPRRIDDMGLAARFSDLGMSGFVLKSHYTMTAERASLVRASSSTDVIGAVTLNWPVGGVNPVAVEICARAGGTFVWLPTFDSINEAGASEVGGSGTPPGWLRLKNELSAKGISPPPIRMVDADGRVLPEVRSVLGLVAQYDMVLCTGHLGRDEIEPVVTAAQDARVNRIIITHPDFPSQQLPAQQQRDLGDRGCLLERCFGTPYAGRVTWEQLFANVRAAGIANSLLSSDLGQPHNPPVEDGVALMVDRFLEAGFTETEVRTMAVTNSRRMAGTVATAS